MTNSSIYIVEEELLYEDSKDFKVLFSTRDEENARVFVARKAVERLNNTINENSPAEIHFYIWKHRIESLAPRILVEKKEYVFCLKEKDGILGYVDFEIRIPHFRGIRTIRGYREGQLRLKELQK